MTLEDAVECNPDTGELFWKIRVNNSVKVGDKIGTKHSRGYLFFRLNKRFYFNHKVVWFLTYGCWPEQELDHINGDKADNRVENLRDVSHRQNMLNKGPIKNGSSSFKGVHWHNKSKKWRASIWNGSSKLHIGMFEEERVAALAYDELAKEIFGEYARTNF